MQMCGEESQAVPLCTLILSTALAFEKAVSYPPSHAGSSGNL